MSLVCKADLDCRLNRHSACAGANALRMWGQRRVTQRRRAGPTFAAQDKQVQSKPQPPAAPPAKSQQQKQQPNQQPPSSPTVLQQIQQQWDLLNWQQRGYAVVLGVVLLAVLPQLLAFGILLLERVLVGGLLAFEEAMVALLFKGGIALGVLVLVGLAAAGVYLFASKATK